MLLFFFFLFGFGNRVTATASASASMLGVFFEVLSTAMMGHNIDGLMDGCECVLRLIENAR
jgi:hypothetical protein